MSPIETFGGSSLRRQHARMTASSLQPIVEDSEEVFHAGHVSSSSEDRLDSSTSSSSSSSNSSMDMNSDDTDPLDMARGTGPIRYNPEPIPISSLHNDVVIIATSTVWQFLDDETVRKTLLQLKLSLSESWGHITDHRGLATAVRMELMSIVEQRAKEGRFSSVSYLFKLNCGDNAMTEMIDDN